MTRSGKPWRDRLLKTVMGLFIAMLFVILLIASPTNRRSLDNMWGEDRMEPSPHRTYARKAVNLQEIRNCQLIPRYIDLEVGDTLLITKTNGENLEILISSVEVESSSYSSPRTRVNLDVHGRNYAAYCGMREPRRGGIGPIEIAGVKMGVEVTRLLFSRMKGGSSPFNTYERLKLQGDVRLGVWDKAFGVMPGIDAQFVVNQPAWTRERFGNWLHSTRYGLHTAIDIFATSHGVPEEVIAPVDGTVYKVYNRDISPDDTRRSKTINIYGDAIVGSNGEKILYRFQHFSKIFVTDGEWVKRGRIIGLTGHAGFNPKIGDHLHLEMRLNPSHFGQAEDKNIFESVPVNPYNFLLEWWNTEERPVTGSQ